VSSCRLVKTSNLNLGLLILMKARPHNHLLNMQ
jgi:hypothetical protein